VWLSDKVMLNQGFVPDSETNVCQQYMCNVLVRTRTLRSKIIPRCRAGISEGHDFLVCISSVGSLKVSGYSALWQGGSLARHDI